MTYWTEEEKQVLRENYGVLSPQKLVGMLEQRHTEKAIIVMASRMHFSGFFLKKKRVWGAAAEDSDNLLWFSQVARRMEQEEQDKTTCRGCGKTVGVRELCIPPNKGFCVKCSLKIMRVKPK